MSIPLSFNLNLPEDASFTMTTKVSTSKASGESWRKDSTTGSIICEYDSIWFTMTESTASGVLCVYLPSFFPSSFVLSFVILRMTRFVSWKAFACAVTTSGLSLCATSFSTLP